MKDRPLRTLLLLSAGLLAAVAVATSLGAARIDWVRAITESSSPDATILFVARLPRVLLAVLAGAGLSVAGVVFQALLRNPLAEPYTLGVSSGASLGALIAIRLGLEFSIFGLGSIPIVAFLCALGTVALVYLVARSGDALPVSSMLLAGITLALFFGAISLFVHFFADLGQSYRFVRWMMGSLDVTGFDSVLVVLPLLALGLAILFSLARELDLLATGDLFAAARGADVDRTIRIAFVGASLVTGSVVAVTGPIGFVGLIVPHLLRIALGAGHRLLLPAAALFGGTFLVLCDLVARTILAPVEIPVGIITALLGGPFFLWLLRSHRHRVLFGSF